MNKVLKIFLVTLFFIIILNCKNDKTVDFEKKSDKYIREIWLRSESDPLIIMNEFKKIKYFENIEYLNIDGSNISEEGFKCIAKMTNLKKIIGRNIHVTDKSLYYMALWE